MHYNRCMSDVFTRCDGPAKRCECDWHRWKRVPWRRRCAIQVSIWGSATLRYRLLPNLRPDSSLFHSGETAQILWSEIRSLPGRMRLLLCNRTEDLCSIDLKLYQASKDARSLLNLQTRACTMGITAMHAKFPAATIYDELLYLEGWSRASQWLCYKAGTAGRDRVRAYEELTDREEIATECEAIVADAFRTPKVP